MGRFPWGIISGILAMIWSFILVGIIVVFVVSGMMHAEVATDEGLRQSLTPLLFSGLIATGIGSAVTLVLSRLK